MDANGWQVTFSVGMVTFDALPENTTETRKIVGDLMYSVKKSQKNALSHISWPHSVH